MKAQDLRIGNWINGFYSDYSEEEEVGKSEFCKVLSLDSVEAMEYPIWVEGKSSSVEVYSSFEPIELSEEILLKCGFEKHSVTGWFISKGRTVTIDFKIELIYINGNIVSRNKNLFKHLHQLQNLYFALTNEELTVNL